MNAPEEKIGSITDHETFKTEMSKRIDLSKYVFKHRSASATLDSYRYELQKEQELKPSKSNFEVIIDGTKITLPITVEDLLNKGFDIIEIDSEPVYFLDVESDLSFGALKVMSPKGNIFSAFAINPGENYQGKMKDCLVTQVDSFFYEDEYEFITNSVPLDAEIKYFKKISMDSSLDDIIKELGYPSLMDYSTAEYKGEITISTLQMRYNFSNKEYNGHTFITLETYKKEDGAKENRIQAIAYSIEFPTK
ncbi:MAG: hypothetical protein IKC10_01365 [Alphaproteobacteria bacterium]|nr:hypothetical protein [Alphaproteobacteria bacterium]